MKNSICCFMKGAHNLGKNLKGRECGKGICQRKDGKYSAHYSAKDGSRHEKHFAMLPEAGNRLAPNARRNYRERYVQNIQPVVGSMLISANR